LATSPHQRKAVGCTSIILTPTTLALERRCATSPTATTAPSRSRWRRVRLGLRLGLWLGLRLGVQGGSRGRHCAAGSSRSSRLSERVGRADQPSGAGDAQGCRAALTRSRRAARRAVALALLPRGSHARGAAAGGAHDAQGARPPPAQGRWHTHGISEMEPPRPKGTCKEIF
jgi:hypothetical protein